MDGQSHNNQDFFTSMGFEIFGSSLVRLLREGAPLLYNSSVK